MTAADIDLTVPTGRPIELLTTESTTRAAPAPSDDETAAQSLTEDPTEVLGEEEDDDVVDYRGTDFDLDLGGSRAPVVLFAVLTGLAVLLGVYATAALPVQIGAGLIAVGAGALGIRATAHYRRNRSR